MGESILGKIVLILRLSHAQETVPVCIRFPRSGHAGYNDGSLQLWPTEEVIVRLVLPTQRRWTVVSTETNI